ALRRHSRHRYRHAHVAARSRSATRGTGDAAATGRSERKSVTVDRIETVAVLCCGFAELHRREVRTHETARRVPRRPEEVMADLVSQGAPERTCEKQVVEDVRKSLEWTIGYQCRFRVTPRLCDPHSCHAGPARCVGQMEFCQDDAALRNPVRRWLGTLLQQDRDVHG